MPTPRHASMRRLESEANYQQSKLRGETSSLRGELVLQEFDCWLLIANRFPYDGIFKQHDMLIPKRDFATYAKANAMEKMELREIIDSDVCEPYDLVFENFMSRRSNRDLYHIHLAAYLNSRDELFQ